MAARKKRPDCSSNTSFRLGHREDLNDPNRMNARFRTQAISMPGVRLSQLQSSAMPPATLRAKVF